MLETLKTELNYRKKEVKRILKPTKLHKADKKTLNDQDQKEYDREVSDILGYDDETKFADEPNCWSEEKSEKINVSATTDKLINLYMKKHYPDPEEPSRLEAVGSTGGKKTKKS